MTERLVRLYMLEATGMRTKSHNGISSLVFYRVDNGKREHIGWDEHPHFAMAQPGACYRYPQESRLVIRTPGGDWVPEGRWTVTGEAPNLTAMPSLLCWGSTPAEEIPIYQRKYHCFLENGVLRELDDTFPG